MSSEHIATVFKKYGASYPAAALDLSIHAVYTLCSYYLLWYFQNSILSIFTIPLMSLINMKTFIIFHDCCHNSYTPSKTLNHVLGTILGCLVYTPYSWSYDHATHHVTNGRKNNQYEFAHTELVFNTFESYKQLSTTKRQLVKCVFSPYMVFTLLANLKFMILNRFHVLYFLMNKYVHVPSFANLLAEQVFHNLGLAVTLYVSYQFGIMYHCIAAFAISSMLGVLLFFNQHTYNPPYITDSDSWSMRDSGLKGSSFILIPWYLKYFTGGIEYHHIHHYNSKIPGYNMRALHDEVVSTSNTFDTIVTLSMSDCYKNLWLSVYDEAANRFITFAEADERIAKNE